MLDVIGLTKTFKDIVACQGISFSVKDGEFFVLLGPSGCGKTTILRVLAGLEKPDNGEVVLKGRKLNDVTPQERNTSMVFQNYALYPNMTVRQNLEFPLKMRKVPKKKRPQIISSIAKLLQIENILDKKATKLSGGQQQRVAMGRALVREPAIFLLDEPLSNLDAKLRHRLRIGLAKLQKKLNITTIYVTHDQAEAMTLADTILVMKQGKVLQIGTPSQIYNTPANLFVARFIGFPEINIFKARFENGWLAILGQTIKPKPWHLPKEVLAAIRPEDIRVLNVAQGQSFEADLEMKEVAGPDVVLYLRAKGIPLRVRAPKEKLNIASRKDRINIEFDSDKLIFFDPKTGKLIKSKDENRAYI